MRGKHTLSCAFRASSLPLCASNSGHSPLSIHSIPIHYRGVSHNVSPAARPVTLLLHAALHSVGPAARRPARRMHPAAPAAIACFVLFIPDVLQTEIPTERTPACRSVQTQSTGYPQRSQSTSQRLNQSQNQNQNQYPSLRVAADGLRYGRSMMSLTSHRTTNVTRQLLSLGGGRPERQERAPAR